MALFKFVKENFWEIFRYGLVGITSATTYWGTSNLLNYLTLPPLVSAGLGWLISSLVSYFGHILFTYKVDASHNYRSWRFLLLSGLNLTISVSFTYLFYVFLALPYYLVSTIITVTIPLISYPLGKFWIFKPQQQGENCE